MAEVEVLRSAGQNCRKARTALEAGTVRSAMPGEVDPEGDPAGIPAHKDEPQVERLHEKTYHVGRSV